MVGNELERNGIFGISTPIRSSYYILDSNAHGNTRSNTAEYTTLTKVFFWTPQVVGGVGFISSR